MVTGIDVAEKHLVAARRAFPGILFLQADPHELPVNLRRRRFDLVYASGLLPYLHDLNAWAGDAAATMRVGGRLLVIDLHPAGACIDTTTLRWRDDYFGGEIVVGHRAQPTAGSSCGRWPSCERDRRYGPRRRRSREFHAGPRAPPGRVSRHLRAPRTKVTDRLEARP
jgi:hypothetical protein